ncbi:homoserine O-acetyltransferase [Bacillus lacus]|uniref:Homoserine O-acetyltransferase n=1 Tax=Metabacillus lacus TaxID=1983721 RepID=A0A7X2M0F5_9BACI|nr:homoserine O-acetyltransferase [Metabacillus lacus]MRX73087.1 homoserine O-acetyltransferase [Metabacillus lacus]
MNFENLQQDESKKTPQYETGTIKIGSYQLESGEKLDSVELAYERAGRRGKPVIVVCHALTGNQYAVGTEENPGWWSGLIGAGGIIDTNEYDVITFNVLGGCSGSTGPAGSKQGRRYGSDFPLVSVRDMVHTQYKALTQMGISSVKAVIGGSLGGMQAFEWSISYPDFADTIVILAAAPELSDYGIAFNSIAIQSIVCDPQFQEGQYPEGTQLKGLEIARMVGMVTYRSDAMYNGRFQREIKTPQEGSSSAQYQVESYLLYQGEKLARRFDPNSYLRLLHAMNSHDIGRGRGGWKEALRKVKAKTLFISFSGDLLYPGERLREASDLLYSYHQSALYNHVDTKFGHDGFLAEYSKWSFPIKEALSAKSKEVAL